MQFAKKIKTLILFSLISFIINVNTAEAGIVKEKISITLSDGTGLASDLYTPENPEKLPVILIRSPYGKGQYFLIAKKLAENGYIVISQDVRGTGESGGTHIPFVNEAKDGLEVLQWIKEQEWYGGKIGMWGASYSAYCASAVASSELLNSVFSISGGSNLELSLVPGDAFHLMMNMTWMHFSKSHMDSTLNKYKSTELIQSIPVIDGFKKIGADKDIDNIGKWFRTSDKPSSVKRTTAYLHVTGWYDFFNILTFDEFNTIGSSSGLPNKIIVGPWFHDQIYKKNTKVGDEDFGPESVMGLNKLTDLVLEWFDYSIKGKENSFSDQKDVKLFVMGKNVWEEYDSFFPDGSQEKTLYLTSSGAANSAGGNGKLTETPGTETINDFYIFDPLDPVPTLGGALFHFYPQLLGVRDQSGIEKRSDVLVYTTDILNENTKIIGNVKAELYVSTEGLNTDFTAKLVEVKKDGYAKILCDGIIRMVKPFRSELVPGKIYKIEIDLGYTAVEIPAGGSIRLEISSSNFPKYDRNPNTGEYPLYAAEFMKVKQTVYHGAEYPSRIKFTVSK